MAKVCILDDIVIKTMSAREMEFQEIASAIGLAPQIIKKRLLRNGLFRVTMERIPPMCVCDMYGYEEEDIPPHIWRGVRRVVRKLFRNGIEYKDITGYNFIEDPSGKIWVIDFEHAKSVNNRCSKFVREFINGRNNWNPYFA
jgi:tRNA A-37 threonylcarbamoyl transferase component Bud32